MLLDMSAEGLLPEDGKVLLEELSGREEEALVRAVLTEGPLPLNLEEKDTSLAVAIRTQWWHFYGLLNFSQFRKEVEQEVARFAQDGADMAEWKRLQPRLEALAALRRGEIDE